MKTLAELRKKMVKGTRWHGYLHQWSTLVQAGSLGERTIVETRTNAIGFLCENGRVSWFDIPKRGCIKFHDDGMGIDVYTHDAQKLVLTYRQCE